MKLDAKIFNETKFLVNMLQGKAWYRFTKHFQPCNRASIIFLSPNKIIFTESKEHRGLLFKNIYFIKIKSTFLCYNIWLFHILIPLKTISYNAYIVISTKTCSVHCSSLISIRNFNYKSNYLFQSTKRTWCHHFLF